MLRERRKEVTFPLPIGNQKVTRRLATKIKNRGRYYRSAERLEKGRETEDVNYFSVVKDDETFDNISVPLEWRRRMHGQAN